MNRFLGDEMRTYARQKCVSSFLHYKDTADMHIDGRTKIYGLIGYPVKHTFSPMMHNAAFKSLGINAAYMAFEVKPKDLKTAISCVRSTGICGLNVTIPHKENVLDHLDEVDKEASLIKAVNTIVIKNGRLRGFNTDGRGFVASIKKAFGVFPKGKDFFIIGAGALIGMGATVNLLAKVGPNAKVGNGATVKEDVPEKGIVRAGGVWP